MYFKVKNAIHAVANVDDYSGSARLLAATTLRNVLGTMTLGEILSHRENIAKEMKVWCLFHNESIWVIGRVIGGLYSEVCFQSSYQTESFSLQGWKFKNVRSEFADVLSIIVLEVLGKWCNLIANFISFSSKEYWIRNLSVQNHPWVQNAIRNKSGDSLNTLTNAGYIVQLKDQIYILVALTALTDLSNATVKVAKNGLRMLSSYHWPLAGPIHIKQNSRRFYPIWITIGFKVGAECIQFITIKEEDGTVLESFSNVQTSITWIRKGVFPEPSNRNASWKTASVYSFIDSYNVTIVTR